MKADINADFYIDNDTKEVLLLTNKSRNLVRNWRKIWKRNMKKLEKK